jgi:hypothetical protein
VSPLSSLHYGRLSGVKSPVVSIRTLSTSSVARLATQVETATKTGDAVGGVSAVQPVTSRPSDTIPARYFFFFFLVKVS